MQRDGGVAPNKYIERIEKNKFLSLEEVKTYISSHLVNVDYLLNNNFNEFVIDRARRILDAIEKATGKRITDRNSEDVINYFGESLEKDMKNT